MRSTRQKCLCRVPGPGGTRQNLFSENKKTFYRVPEDDTRQSFFFKKIKINFAERLAFPSARHSAKSRFAEWLTLPSD